MIESEIDKNKGQYDLDGQTATILALSSQNVGRCDFFADGDIYPEKGSLEKAAKIKKKMDILH